MNKKLNWLYLLLAAMILMSTACSSNGSKSGDGAPAGDGNHEPVKLVVFQALANISDEEFRELIAEPVKRKYPYISLELVHADQDKTPESLVASGNIPDLVFTNPKGVQTFKDLNAAEDLTVQIQTNKFDLNKFEPTLIDAIKFIGDQEKIYAVPFSINFNALFYNKDLFDKFGVPYPKDGMTWEEVTELSKKLTRVENGQQYYGLDQAGVDLKASQLSLRPYDPKTKKATLTQDGYVRIFQLHKAALDIAGNKVTNNIKTFENERTLAMLANKGARLGELEDLHNQGNPMNWDLVSFPTMPEAPKVDADSGIHLLLVTSTSKYKDAAFKVLEVVSDPQNQQEMNKRGRLTTLKDPKIKEGFGANLKSLKGKNVKGIFYNTPSSYRYNDKFSDIVKAQIPPAMAKVTKGEADINTALREAEELANKKIEEELKKGNSVKK